MAESALWKRVSETEKKSIEKEAKKIMDNFSRELEKAEKEVKKEEFFVERDSDRREEKESAGCKDEDFRKIMLKNAKNKTRDCIVAEKGGWV